MISRIPACVLAFVFPAIPLCAQPAAIQLEAADEYWRPDPFGGIVAADGASTGSFRRSISLAGARGGYVSFHLVVKTPAPGAYSISLRFDDDAAGVQTDLFREWFHFTESDRHHYPDALI